MPFLPPNQQCQSTEGQNCFRVFLFEKHNIVDILALKMACRENQHRK